MTPDLDAGLSLPHRSRNAGNGASNARPASEVLPAAHRPSAAVRQSAPPSTDMGLQPLKWARQQRRTTQNHGAVTNQSTGRESQKSSPNIDRATRSPTPSGILANAPPTSRASRTPSPSGSTSNRSNPGTPSSDPPNTANSAITHLQSALTQSLAQVQALENRVLAATTEINTLKSQLAQADSLFTSTHARLTVVQDRAAATEYNLTNELRRVTTEREMFKSAHVSSTTRANNLQDTLTEREKEIDRWRAELQMQEGQVSALRGQLAREQTQTRVMETRWNRVLEQRMGLGQELNALPPNAVVSKTQVMGAVDKLLS